VPDESKSEAAKTSAAKESEEPTYEVDRLIAESDDRFGVPSYVAAGAFSSSRKKNLTIEEGKKLIRDYQKQAVAVDNPIPTAETEEVES
jgi:hypothetical protein